MVKALNKEEIKEIIPQREPFLMVENNINKTKDEGGYVRGANYYGGKNND